MVKRFLEIDGIPSDGGIGEEGETSGLIGKLIRKAVSETGLAGKEEETAQGMERFALVELSVYLSTIIGLID